MFISDERLVKTEVVKFRVSLPVSLTGAGRVDAEELPTLRKCKADRSEHRFRRRTSKSLIPQALLHALPETQIRQRRLRSGTWP
ncbi:hypothetical protein KGM_215491 [Danaus plexippus plexippus]|uniref:Uncharacterized protein n=1 Tax=Danaus plexippus plexippus TaxID=278856 RepID=A0A212EJL5_DANPL|nr:hypothetical protein KGM_215491 [Danaus plexippus plexippus]